MAPIYPSGYTQAQAVAMVQSRTNYRFGQLIASDIITYLNAGIQQIQRDLRQVITTAPILVTQANQAQFPLPADMQNVLDVTYSTADPTLSGQAIYSLDEIEYSVFMELTQQVRDYAAQGMEERSLEFRKAKEIYVKI